MRYILFFLIAICTQACNNFGKDIFNTRTPKEKYEDKIEKTSPRFSEAWINAGNFALANPLKINLPYAEYARVNQGKADATAYTFTAKPGQKITIQLQQKDIRFTTYTELYEVIGESKNLVATADTLLNRIEYTITNTNQYIIRTQPQLEATGNFTVQISTSPSLFFPVDAKAKSNIGSLWGDARDGGKRKHEGIDIMAAKGTNLVAVADAEVDYVSENELGGKVISLRPNGQNFTVYYAHLDQQLVQDGQQVKKGQVIGTVGNTGNARTTVPHLHFGIYTRNGAVDPLGFVQGSKTAAEPAKTELGKVYQLGKNTAIYPAPEKKNPYKITVEKTFTTEGYSNNYYRVLLDNGAKVYISAADLKKAVQFKM